MTHFFTMDSEMERKQCILCESDHISILFRRSDYEMLLCKTCGLIYRWPPVNKSHFLDEVIQHYSHVDPVQEVAQSRRGMYEQFLRQIRPLKKGSKQLLDVGSGLGYFLSLAKEEGWNVMGIEANPELVEKGTQKYGIKIQCADFEEANLPSGYFDVVTLWNILEELSDPLASIIKIKKILKPSGILFLRTPNSHFHLFIFRIQKLLIKLHLGHMIPHQSSLFHIFNFSNKILRQILEDNGFSNIRIKNSRPTTGDPYGVKKGVSSMKKIAYFSAQSLSFITFCKLTLAPSIEVYAENGKG